MHLTQLRENIEGLLAQHGDAQMRRVLLVGHAGQALLAFRDATAEADDAAKEPNPIAEAETQHAENSVRKDLLLAIAEGVSIEDRFAAAGPEDLIALTYEELAQLLEYREELKGSYQTKGEAGTEGGKLGLVPAREMSEAESKALAQELASKLPKPIGCPDVHVAKGACKLEAGHEGEHVWENADAQLDPTAQEVERELGQDPAVDTLRCDNWKRGQRCVLAHGHDSPHDFNQGNLPVTEAVKTV